MSEEAKAEAVDRMGDSVQMLDETLKSLADEYANATPADRKRIVVQQTRTLAEKTAEGIFLNHVRAAGTRVDPPTPASYAELDAGLEKLVEMKTETGNVVRILQLASAITAHAQANQAEVDVRTNP